MTTQVAFATDAKLKTAVSKKLKANGMTLKGFFNYCMKAYNNGEIDFSIRANHNPLYQRRLEAQQELFNGETITIPSSIQTAEEFSNFLETTDV